MPQLPTPPTGFLRAMLQCSRCQLKKQFVVPEAGLPLKGTVLNKSFGATAICIRCRSTTMVVVTPRPQAPLPPPPTGWARQPEDVDD